jgi:hypothetical protein
VTLQTQAARIGYLDVGRIPFPEYLNRYLNLAISIAPLCALAINKARIAENLRNKVIQLDQKNRELEAAQAQIKVLAGIIPICMYCKEIRDDKGYWNKLENFITQHSEAEFSHGICDKCMEEKYGYLLDEQKPL